MIGVQTASAYVGTCLIPPLFGRIATHAGASVFPAYLAVLLLMMVLTHESLLHSSKRGAR